MLFALAMPLSVLAVIALIAVAYHFHQRGKAFEDGKTAGYLEAKKNFAKAPSTLPRIVTFKTDYGLEREILEPWDYTLHASRLGSRDSAQEALSRLEIEMYSLQHRVQRAERFSYLHIPATCIAAFYVPFVVPLQFAGREMFPDWVHYLGVTSAVVCILGLALVSRLGLSIEEGRKLRETEQEVDLLRFHLALMDATLKRIDQLIEATEKTP